MNRKEKGYIYIFTIVLISILALFFYLIYSYTTNRAYINFNKVEKIQSKYAAESVLNMKIYGVTKRDPITFQTYRGSPVRGSIPPVLLSSTALKADLASKL